MSSLSTTFTKKDLALLRRKAELKAELAEIDAVIKPKIEKAVRSFGVKTLKAHGATLILNMQTRITTKWKGLAESMLSQDQIDAAFDEFSTESKVYSMKEAIDTE